MAKQMALVMRMTGLEIKAIEGIEQAMGKFLVESSRMEYKRWFHCL
jgi:hypothetical protein